MRTAHIQLRCAFHSSTRIASRILSPPAQARSDARAWQAAIEPFLPAHLRAESSSLPDLSSTITTYDLISFFNRCQDASLDILGYLGLAEGRWQIAVWLVKKLAENGRRSTDTPALLDPFKNIHWPGAESLSLHTLTNQPLRAERISPLRRPDLTLDDLTSAPDSINVQYAEAKRAIGQIWRSLGNMIISATRRDSVSRKLIMLHVLEIIAHLHHKGFIPDEVYTYHPHGSGHALQQPPTLHILSSKILTALSDASWRAHEATVNAAKAGAKASYFLGHEIPGSRYRVRITEIAPELWLELILWSCLHGGWVLDGNAILKQLALQHGEQRWTPISWRELIYAAQEKEFIFESFWKLFSMREDSIVRSENRVRMQRTISGEVVTAFIDGLVNQMRLGVGRRGTDPGFLLNAISVLKGFLDTHNLNPDSMTWDSIMVRLLDSGGFVPEKRTEFLLHIFGLAAGFATKTGMAKESATGHAEMLHLFEPATVALNLLHRAIRIFTANEDLKCAINALKILQKFTEDNKQASIQEFRTKLRSPPPSQDNIISTSRFPPVDFPAFELRLPIVVLAKLLDLATNSKFYDFGRWLLLSNDSDGPLISPELYHHRKIAASIVRFGTLAGENELVLKVVKELGSWNLKHQQQRMPAEIFIALFCCQIKLRRWDSVKGMQQYVEETMTFRPRPVILSMFAAELLRVSNSPEEAKIEAQETFAQLLFAWEKLILSNIRNELYCVLSILSTVDMEWKQFCSPFMAVSLHQSIELSTEDFNQVLEGVLDGYGSSKAMEMVDRWCHKAPDAFAAYRAPGGLPTMPKFRVDKGQEYDRQPGNIELIHESGHKLVLQGRVHPSKKTSWAILRKAQEEVSQRGDAGLTSDEHAKVQKTLEGAMHLLFNLGLEYEDIIRDLDTRLIEIAGVKIPAASPKLSSQ